ncbi:DUF4221 family protein [Litoribacter ruber]|uniref:DUF4221 family protein n=1 Tax=Litoribacter ruber TaxID=702568 RepID=UPI001BDA6F54|nr:DUF4221 family protein [Litoribacter ruber]MBT0812522.1 DUF4221 family protein [Litoribacter ruber]
MKKFYPIFAAALFFACSENPKDLSQSQSLSLNFELDTVMVDAGDDIIFLAGGLHQSDLSSDGTTFYNFDFNENLLEVIDLDNLRLSHKIPFEKEGPNGTGNVYGVQNLSDGRYLLSNFTSIGIFSEQGQREDSYDFSKVPSGILEEGEVVSSDGILSEDGKYFVSFYAKGWAGAHGIAKLDLETREILRFPVDQLKALDRYTMKSHDEYKMEISMVANHLSWHEEKLLISNSVENQLLVIDPNHNSISQHSYEALLTPNYSKEPNKRDFDTFEEIGEVGETYRNEVYFGKWLFDPLSERFYRLSHIFEREVGEDQEEYKVVLTVFDKDFQQLYEGLTPLKSNYFNPFVRGGKLYLFENINDELAFIVLTINEA